MRSMKRSEKIQRNEFKLWLNRNPLTIWMRRNKISQTELAARLGVSTYAVYLWQRGTSSPTPERFQKLAKLTGIEDLIIKWAEWKDEINVE